MSSHPQQDKPAGLPCANSSASFWHSEPNTFLYGHRSTPSLPEKADIVIVGSGITGASVARFLTLDKGSQRAKGMSICLLEAREVCWGATGRNGGHCQPLLFDRSPDVAEFEVRNVASVQDYIETNNVDCEWRTVTGCRTFWDEQTFDAAKDEIEKLREVMPEMAQKVKAVKWGDKGCKEMFKENKVIADGRCKGITLTQGAGQLWPYKYVTSILEKAVKEGKLNLQTNTPVTNVESVEDNKEGMRQRVKTPRGSVLAKHVILATNGYTSHLLKDFAGLIVPTRCEMSALHPPTGSDRLPNSYGMVGFESGNPEHDDYLIQRPFYDSPNGDGTKRGGHLMFGGGRGKAMYNCIGETDDDIVDPGEADYLRRSLLQMLELGGNTEGLKELKASHQWTGIKGYSRDNMPWVGKVPKRNGKIGNWEDGLWLAGGYTGHGMPNATLCGKAVVEMVFAEEKYSDKGYGEVCASLVKAKELPISYVITAERLEAALKMPSVREQEESFGLKKSYMKEIPVQEEGRKKQGKCAVM